MAEIHVHHNRGGRRPVPRTYDEAFDTGRSARPVTDTPAAHATLSMWDLGKAAFWRGMPHRQMMEHTCPAFHEGWWVAHSTVRMIGGTHAHFNVD